MSESIQWQANLDPSVPTAAALTPEIARSLEWCRANKRQLGFVSVADGPGSFTGLRIGVTTAKSLCYALDIPLVAVDSLAAIAAAAFGEAPHTDSILVGVNAYRGQVFHGEFDRQSLLGPLDDGASQPTWTAHPDSVQISQNDSWRDHLASWEGNRGVAGDDRPFGERATELISRPCDAVGVGMLAIRAAVRGQWSDPLALVPRYLKPSAAEENAAASSNHSD